MAKKKTKRPNLSQETLERARAELRGDRSEPVAVAEKVSANGGPAVAAAKPKRATAPNLATRRIPSIEELIKEYSYVLKDLRNLAILAIVLLLAIVVAAVVLPRPTG
jgi:hypothetical protein